MSEYCLLCPRGIACGGGGGGRRTGGLTHGKDGGGGGKGGRIGGHNGGHEGFDDGYTGGHGGHEGGGHNGGGHDGEQELNARASGHRAPILIGWAPFILMGWPVTLDGLEGVVIEELSLNTHNSGWRLFIVILVFWKNQWIGCIIGGQKCRFWTTLELLNTEITPMVH